MGTWRHERRMPAVTWKNSVGTRYIEKGKGKDLLERKANDQRVMVANLKEVDANYKFLEMCAEKKRWEYNIEKAVTKHFLGVKGSNKDAKRHQDRETDILRDEKKLGFLVVIKESSHYICGETYY
ncbi:hypothetical protein M758_UG202900 [Ceratodon purpureus]|nr:hypothetical protein M758_UG202900 [Ceratodon purpureus]